MDHDVTLVVILELGLNQKRYYNFTVCHLNK